MTARPVVGDRLQVELPSGRWWWATVVATSAGRIDVKLDDKPGMAGPTIQLLGAPFEEGTADLN